ncbi:hypothetical protein PSR1_04535 [Anaeromyxobacter sp. PSR-1]|nr:hypothetical protein PSR1_04535 [Anaeromyxobacter sp. PSR-1]
MGACGTSFATTTLRRCRTSSSASRFTSSPRSWSASISRSSAAPSRPTSAAAMRDTAAASTAPSASATASSPGASPQAARTWSSSDSASRMPPSAWRATSASAAGDSRIPSSAATLASWSAICCSVSRRKSKRWQRERMVSGTLWTSVVASTNFTCGGGSSSVFRSALNAPCDSMWTSSTTNTLKRSRAGRYFTASTMSRTLSTPLLEAASISTTSTARPSAISTQGVQTPHGSAVGPFSQLSAFATRRAVVVLPTPRGPVNRNAWASWPVLSAFDSVRTTCSWPDISPKRCGRYLRARTR